VCARKSRCHTEPEQDAARGPPLRTQGASPPAKPPGRGPRGEGVDPVADDRQENKDEPEGGDLERNSTLGDVDELREEGKEEQRGLRVQHVDNDALRKEPPQTSFLGRPSAIALVSAEQAHEPEENEIGGSSVFDEAERHGRSNEERGETGSRRRDMHQGSPLDPQHRNESGHPAPAHALRHDVEDGRARNDEQHQRRDGEDREAGGVGKRHVLGLAHEALSGSRDQRDGLGEEDAHRVAKGCCLLLGRPLDFQPLERGACQLDSRVQGERGELLALRLVHSLGLLLGELTQATHQLLGITAKGKAESTFHAITVPTVPQFTESLNGQIAYEFGASQQYVAIAVWYDAETLPQLAAHFYRQALEERNHAMMIVQYLLDAGATVSIPAIAEPQNDFADPVAPVRLALEQERTVTEQISRLASLAREENDLVGAEFLNWFLKEQREEVASMSALLAIVERASDNILLAEEYLVRQQIGDAGVDPTAPPAAGGAL
jgi:ferritin